MNVQQTWENIEDALTGLVIDAVDHEAGAATDKELSEAKRGLREAIRAYGEAIRAEERAAERLHMTDWMSRRETIRLTTAPMYWDALLADIARGAHRPGVK